MTRLRNLTIILAGCAIAATAQTPLKPPVTRKLDVADTYFGTLVPDPYRWLEDDNSLDTKAWVKAQNEVAEKYLSGIPERTGIQDRMTKLWNYERYSAPSKYGNLYFYTYNTGLQNQSVLYVTDKLAEKGRALLDPNTLSANGTVALSGMSVSDDGKYLAYSLSNAGSDWVVWKVRDVATGKDLTDEIQWSKFSGAAWKKDASGFYYSRYDAPKGDDALTGLNKFQKVYFHRIGDPQESDQLVFERKNQPDWGFGAYVSEDGRWLIVNQTEGTERKNRIFVKDLDKSDSEFQPMFDDFDASYDFLGNDSDTFYIATDHSAPRGRIIAVNLKQPARSVWREIIPQASGRDVIAGASLFGDKVAVTWKIDALNQVKLYDLKNGKNIKQIRHGGVGTLTGFSGKRSDSEAYYGFTSYNEPPTIYRYDLKTGKETVFRKPKVDMNSSDFEVRQDFYNSKDGTRIPIFLACKKGAKLDGTNPTLLYGYGGFNSAVTPGFSPANLVWMEMGGVYAVACIRGGDEYGKEWWEQGKRELKQNCFDDFIAAGEWLIAKKYTSTPKLAIHGASNGGLLVGACMTQRPDLFGAAIPAVGVLDMLRYHKFTIGWAWQSDYMCSDTKEGFDNLIKYSPLHNIVSGAKYPATLITTGDHDDRVVPAHSHKFTATLQEAQGGTAPILTRIETDAGHGAGKPMAKVISERADMWAFLLKNLDIKLPEGFGK
ncbi:MAG: prolyl oligopeptidase family serine peptidase [Holophagales bacterium]|jgi:prolyl oligopeptidase|nr:prolyl oligopeptidase family serine peptidase [Holophagales bacterium]